MGTLRFEVVKDFNASQKSRGKGWVILIKHDIPVSLHTLRLHSRAVTVSSKNGTAHRRILLRS
jgi:hypothetical protein